MNTDWIVTLYDENNSVVKAYIIEDRTEHEADNEATPYAMNADDWSLQKIDEAVEAFMEEFGYTHDEAAELNDVTGGGCAESEMLINFGYVWVQHFEKWINKNNSLYDERDEVLVDYIRKKYC